MHNHARCPLRDLLRDIRSAMDYAVPEDRRPAADDLVDEYKDDRLALTLLREFYSFLPDAAIICEIAFSYIMPSFSESFPSMIAL